MTVIMTDIEIYCAECRRELTLHTQTKERFGTTSELYVEPCEKCMEEISYKGYEKGLEESTHD